MKSCKVLAKVLANPCQTISQATLARTPDLLQSDPTLETVLFHSFLSSKDWWILSDLNELSSRLSALSLSLCGSCDRLRRNETSNLAEVQKNEE